MRGSSANGFGRGGRGGRGHSGRFVVPAPTSAQERLPATPRPPSVRAASLAAALAEQTPEVTSKSICLTTKKRGKAQDLILSPVQIKLQDNREKKSNECF
jgi:hypothetical protein